MGGQDRETRIIDIAEARDQLDALIDLVAGYRGRVVIQRNGKTVAALVTASDLERVEMLDRRAAEGWEAIQEIWALNADIDVEEAEIDIAEEIAAMRAEARAKESAASAAPRT